MADSHAPTGFSRGHLLLRLLVAGIYDLLLVIALWFTVGFVRALFLVRENQVVEDPYSAVMFALLFVIDAAYFVWFLLRRDGATPGLRAWQLGLHCKAGQSLSVPRVLARWALGRLSLVLLGLPYLLVLAKDQQTLQTD